MGYEFVRSVLENSKAVGGARLVLVILADRANEHGRSWPSIETIAKESGFSRRNVKYVLLSLKAIGELSVEVGKGPLGCNIYNVLGGATLARGQSLPGAKCSMGGGKPIAPDPSEENHQEEDLRSRDGDKRRRDNRGNQQAPKPEKPRPPIAEISCPREHEFEQDCPGCGERFCAVCQGHLCPKTGAEYRIHAVVGPSKPRKPTAKKRTSAPRPRKPDLYGLPAQELATHLHDEYRRVYDQEQDPLTEAFGTSIGHAKRLLRLKYPTGPPKKLNGEKGVLTWWLEHWNEGREGTEFELHDFSMQKFVAKFTPISNRMETWADAKKARRRVR